MVLENGVPSTLTKKITAYTVGKYSSISATSNIIVGSHAVQTIYAPTGKDRFGIMINGILSSFTSIFACFSKECIADANWKQRLLRNRNFGIDTLKPYVQRGCIPSIYPSLSPHGAEASENGFQCLSQMIAFLSFQCILGIQGISVQLKPSDPLEVNGCCDLEIFALTPYMTIPT
ncbi:hypothetical protein BJV82DRAFT_654550 [Fennellomyces sp. T-0311]|nr:hypothetical protein BJV82DRAFT_654550 [Fennellomyces sp. T-0311]